MWHFKKMFYRSTLIIALQIFILKALAAQENILLKKPAYANDYKEYIKNSNDGDKTTGMWLRSKNVMYIVFDLQSVYNVEKVIITNGKYRGEVPFTIYVGDEMRICHLHRQIKNYKVCKSGVIQNSNDISVNCAGSGVKGRYIAIVKGEFLTEKLVEELNFYEIEAYGQLIGAGPQFAKPTIPSQLVQKASRNDFPLARELRKNIPVMKVDGYSMGFVKINEKCEPIIWDVKWNLTFAFACYTDNKQGKALFFGKEWYFWYIMNDADKTEIRTSFVNWLSSGNKNPNYVNSENFKTISDVRGALKDGDILDFHTTVDYPDEVIEEIKSLLARGKISLVFDHDSFIAVDEKVTRSNDKIMNMFNIASDTTYFTFGSSGEYTIKDSDFTEEFLDLKVRLRKLVDNYDYLLENGQFLLNSMNKMPPKIIENAKLDDVSKDFLKKYDYLISYICPCKDDPATDVSDRSIISIFGLFAKSQGLAHSKYKLPCIDLFPMDFKSAPKLKQVVLEVFGEIAYTRIPIGYYLPAGETLKYKIQASTGKWGISVGCHSDILGEKRSEWYRYPDIYTNSVPLSEEGTIFSPFGGVLWLVNSNENASISIHLSNVVLTPFFNILDESAVSDWNENQRKHQGLWAQIAGEDMVFCERSDRLRQFDGQYLKSLMESWDRVVRNNYVFAGLDWRKYRPSQTVLDIMTSVGYAHSGYPVSTYDDWFVNIFDSNYIKEKGSWGMCHELGHNQQEFHLWTMSTVSEATNNIFCLFNTAKEWKLPYYGSTKELLDGNYDEIKSYLDGGADLAVWKESAYLELAIYVQMANHFGFGFFNKAFKYYLNHPELKADSDEEKYDLWANVTSTITNQNLMPIFDLWNIPIGDEMRKYLSKFQCFLPDDFFLKSSRSREEFILKKYPDCHRKSTFYEDFNPESLTQGHRPNFIKKKL
uniref:Peptidase M60 domain-containing protein n=1 Tax=Schmidtea mediterranea TaxID=79327 RepID=A0A1S6KMG0_SCHMD|nr:hypothetical protein Smed-FAM115A-like protein [Schmidtea mediterranea]